MKMYECTKEFKTTLFDNIERFLESTAKLIRYSDTLEMYHREMEV